MNTTNPRSNSALQRIMRLASEAEHDLLTAHDINGVHGTLAEHHAALLRAASDLLYVVLHLGGQPAEVRAEAVADALSNLDFRLAPSRE